MSAMLDCTSIAERLIRGRFDAYIAEYTEEMRDDLLHEQQIVNDMVDALRNGEFEPWFQPQYNHATGAQIGSEALVRWIKCGSIIPPNSFIPVFERNRFVYKVDQYIWRQVCAALRRWLDEGRSPFNEFWNPKSMETLIFNSYVGGACIFEFFNGKSELLRVNEQYARELGSLIPVDLLLMDSSLVRFLDAAGKEALTAAIYEAIARNKEESCEVRLSNGEHAEHVRITLRTIVRTAERYLFYAVILNMSDKRTLECQFRAQVCYRQRQILQYNWLHAGAVRSRCREHVRPAAPG